MTEETELDRAHAAMMSGGDPERLAFYQSLADSELVLWLDAEPEDDHITPKTISSEGADYVLAFDTDERLAELAQSTVARLSLSGRALAHMLTGQNTGLALNMGDAPSAILLPPSAIDWLVSILSHESGQAHDAAPVGFRTPEDVPASLKDSLLRGLRHAHGVAEHAMLVRALYEGGGTGVLLAVIGAKPEARAALQTAVSEAVAFSAHEPQPVDVVFLEPDDPSLGRMRPVAMMLDLSEPDVQPAVQISPPGMDPDTPPRLK